MTTDAWPHHLWIVRHGESAGNAARDAALVAGLSLIDIATRDMDVPLSPLGERQSRALGRWFAGIASDDRPKAIVSSPYKRAVLTAETIRGESGIDLAPTVTDERLRERDLGALDRLTSRGIIERYPGEAVLRARIGKFYYRPPGGESWCDVILRLRSFIDTLCLRHAGDRVLIVGHQIIVLGLRYVLEDMTEAEILAVDSEGDVANCSVTEYAFDPRSTTTGPPALLRYNFTLPLEADNAPVTTEPSPESKSA
jgi:2,3-bisphosphoglycerate-dependent phosphoglycerate mutase